jgi:dipeptidase E
MTNAIIASTSTLHNGSYLDYLVPLLEIHFNNVKEILFIPYARPSGISHETYTAKVAEIFKKINIQVKGIHEFQHKKEAIKNAEAIFVGGGNTFVLVSELYRSDLLDCLEDVIKKGVPYLGTSAGSNITGLTMGTTNDMPIVMPKSFQTLKIIPFNINAHYLEPEIGSKHMGETRETRIKEFHYYNSQPVLGLREGSWLEVKNNKIVLKGSIDAKWFVQNKTPIEIPSGTNIFTLL